MFSVILFLVCFCVASIALYEPTAVVETKVDLFDQFYSAVKEVFALEPEVEAEEIRSLSTSQAENHNQAETIINSVRVTPQSQATTQFTIRQLRNYIREQNLQATIKEQLGKSVNHCRKEELLSVLFA